MFSRALSFVRWKWPRHKSIEQPTAAVEVCIVVKSQGKANYWQELDSSQLE